MPPNVTTDAVAGRESSRARLVLELESRIAEIEATDDSEVGHFTARDWVICIGGAVIAPAAAMWWFAG